MVLIVNNLSVNINYNRFSKDVQTYNNYYPFGLKHKGYNNVITGRDHKYGFGGKEYNDELGLDWYDVSARNYEPALGRWMNLDPLAEQIRRHSPYNFGFDNPIYFQDYDGMMPSGPGDELKKKVAKAEGKVIDAIETAGRFLKNPIRGAVDFFSSGGGGDQAKQTVSNKNIERKDGGLILEVIGALVGIKNQNQMVREIQKTQMLLKINIKEEKS